MASKHAKAVVCWDSIMTVLAGAKNANSIVSPVLTKLITVKTALFLVV